MACGLLLHKKLKVVAASSPVDGIDPFGVVNILNQILQLGGRIPRQPCEARLLPEAGQDIEIIDTVAAIDYPRSCLSSHVIGCSGQVG